MPRRAAHRAAAERREQQARPPARPAPGGLPIRAHALPSSPCGRNQSSASEQRVDDDILVDGPPIGGQRLDHADREPGDTCAPGTLPKPPRQTTTKAMRPTISPTVGDDVEEHRDQRAGNAGAGCRRPQARACMRSGRMPISIAALRSSATASSWLPSVVRVSSRCMPRVSSARPARRRVRPRHKDAAEVQRAADKVSGRETKFAEKAQNAA